MKLFAKKVMIGAGEKWEEPKPMGTDIMTKPRSMLCVQNMISTKNFVHRSLRP